MRKVSLLFFLLAFAVSSFSQGRNLWQVSSAKPKMDQVTAFEAALKAHSQKFHPASNPMYVYEILSGDHAGSYQFIHGPSSWASMDSSTPNPEHDADWEKNIAPKLASESGVETYRYVDSISYNNAGPSDKQRLQFVNFKPGTDFSEAMDYYKKLKAVYEKNKDNRSYSMYVHQLAGNHTQFVYVWRYSNWAEMEMDYYKPLKPMYEKEYGQRAWDEWMKFIDDHVADVNAFIRKRRTDLGTPPSM